MSGKEDGCNAPCCKLQPAGQGGGSDDDDSSDDWCSFQYPVNTKYKQGDAGENDDDYRWRFARAAFFFQYEDVAMQALRNIPHAVADAHAAQGLSA